MGLLSNLFGGSGGGGSTGFSGGGIGSTANETQTTTDNQNNATSGDGSAVYDSRGGNISFSEFDGGAIEQAFLFARDSLGLVERNASQALQAFNSGLAQSLETSDAERTGGSNRVMYTALAALGVVAVLMFLRR